MSEEGNKLAPCPHCGSEVDLVHSPNERIISFICPPESTCVGSGLGTFALAEKLNEAIEAWNRRVNYNE
jgi:hypothetical protein